MSSDLHASGTPLTRKEYRALGWLTLLSVIARILYALWTRHLFGDGVQYEMISRQLAGGGELQEAMMSWYGLFCIWQAPFHLLLSGHTAAVMSSLIPGALLAAVAFLLARMLFSTQAAWIAGILTAIHPNLINYAVSGYAESSYIFLFAIAITATTSGLLRPRSSAFVLAGLAFGTAFAIRNEIAPVAALCLGLPFLSGLVQRLRKSKSLPAPDLGLKNTLIGATTSLLPIACFALISHSLIGSSGLLGKTENFSRTGDMLFNWKDSAEEVYGEKGHLHTKGETKISLPILLEGVAKRLPFNLTKALPNCLVRMLASPAFLFMIPLGLIWIRKRRIPQKMLPTLIMLVFAPAFYVLFFVEPRYLQPCLVPVHVLAAGGLVASAKYLLDEKPQMQIRALMALTVALLSIHGALTLWRGDKLKREAEIHQNLAYWITEHVPSADSIKGCGIGFITDTTFKSGHQGSPRVVSSNPDTVAASAEERGIHWIILYEEFIKEANPELLDALDNGLPHYAKVFETKNAEGLRASILKHIDYSPVTDSSL